MNTCSKLFWKACKKKHQGWDSTEHYCKRETLKSVSPKKWIKHAFNWKDNIIYNNYDKWHEISSKWAEEIEFKKHIFDTDQ